MLYTVTIFVLGLGTALSEVRRNDVDTRYFIGPFNGGEFPMTIDRCLPTSIIGDTFQRVTCISETEVVWRQYDDAECISTILLELTTNTSTQNGMGSYFDFNCNPSYGDEYASIEFSVGDCDTDTKVTMDGALDVCSANTDIFFGGDLSDAVSIRVYCNKNIAELQYFDSPNSVVGVCDDSGSDSNFLYLRNATRSCGYMLTVSGLNIFGKIITCTVDPLIPTVQPTDYPTEQPTDEPTGETEEPTDEPTDEPTSEPSDKPTITPTIGLSTTEIDGDGNGNGGKQNSGNNSNNNNNNGLTESETIALIISLVVGIITIVFAILVYLRLKAKDAAWGQIELKKLEIQLLQAQRQ